jgi:transposase
MIQWLTKKSWNCRAALYYVSRTISRALKKIEFTQKKKTYGYLERDESKRQTLIEELANQVNEMIVYVDEAGMDNP